MILLANQGTQQPILITKTPISKSIAATQIEYKKDKEILVSLIKSPQTSLAVFAPIWIKQKAFYHQNNDRGKFIPMKQKVGRPRGSGPAQPIRTPLAQEIYLAMKELEKRGVTLSELLADQLDADWLLQDLDERGTVAVIPPKTNRKIQCNDDAEIYK